MPPDLICLHNQRTKASSHWSRSCLICGPNPSVFKLAWTSLDSTKLWSQGADCRSPGSQSCLESLVIGKLLSLVRHTARLLDVLAIVDEVVPPDVTALVQAHAGQTDRLSQAAAAAIDLWARRHLTVRWTSHPMLSAILKDRCQTQQTGFR
jgi:hypothetical protein